MSSTIARRRREVRRELLAAAGVPVTDHRADIAGIPTAWFGAGPADAPPVVLLHGALSSGLCWLRLLPDLARRHRVLVPDLPGYGDSGRGRYPYTRRWYAAWLAGFLDGPAGGRADLVANSLGGAVATELALDRPRLVGSLALVSPVAVGPATRPELSYALAVLGAVVAPRWRRDRLLRRLWAGVAGTGPAPGPDETAATADRIAPDPDRAAPVRKRAATRSQPSPDDTRAAGYALDGLALPGGRRAPLRQGDVVRPFAPGRLAALRTPTLLIWGEQDRITPVPPPGWPAANLPNARLEVVAGAGHAAFLDRPDVVLDLLHRSLTRTDTYLTADGTAAPANPTGEIAGSG